MVDLMHQYGFNYAAISPGSSFRVLHDSLVTTVATRIRRSFYAATRRSRGCRSWLFEGIGKADAPDFKGERI